MQLEEGLQLEFLIVIEAVVEIGQGYGEI